MYPGQPRATPAERAHLALVRSLPCCVCNPGLQNSPTEAQHLLLNGRRMGHYFTIPLCRTPHHAFVTRFRKLFEQTHGEQRALWEETMAKLGVTGVEWPLSKIVARVVA